jgi:hypothetical protein
MITMTRFRGFNCLLIWPLAFALTLATSCSRPGEVAAEDGTGQPPTPFHDEASSSTEPKVSSDSGFRQDENAHPGGLPFHDAQSLPAGTLLRVRLMEPISAGKPSPQGSFQGIIDEAVMVDGNALVPKGTEVIGLVESARISNLKPDRGYVRLVLKAVHLAGTDLPVHTASLFVRQSSGNAGADPIVHLAKGHRLVFRLTEPVFLSNQNARASR